MQDDLSHIDSSGNPAMVDVSHKDITRRSAHARAEIILPHEILTHLEGGEIESKKGPVFQTAIIAGTMGAKKTGALIPFCHPIGLEDCKILIHVSETDEVIIDCHVVVNAKTGVEMEALTGVTIAALTVYDMCKSMSHDIVVKNISLLEKTGGKSDYNLSAMGRELAHGS